MSLVGFRAQGFNMRHRRAHWTADGHSKVTYANRPAALEAARRLRAELHRDVAPYECRLCGAWHVGRNRPPFRPVDSVEWEMFYITLGGRVRVQLHRENYGSEQKRCAALTKRCAALLRYRKRGWRTA